MENNTDKELKDKLQSLDFPFDPKAWEQMESKLEENRKPKGLVWWWFGGIAAGLAIILGVYSYYQQSTGMNNHDTKLSSNKLSSYNNDNPSISNTANTSGKPNTLSNANTTKPQSSETSHSTNHGPETNTTPINKSPHTNKISPSNPSSEKPKTLAINLAASSLHGITAKKGSADMRYKFIDQQKRTSGKATPQSSKPSLSSINNTPSSKGVPSLAPQAAKTESAASLNELDGMTTMQVDELTHVSDDDIMTKKEDGDVNLKKLHKKIFTYSLGASANVTGSNLSGKSATGSPSHVFAHVPSYMAGITHDFTFLNRFAITNSLLFSRTSFTVPNAYSSNITELAIPIGVKGYLVSKSKFRFYLGAGIINHIKLKETYTYQNLPNTFNPQTNNPSAQTTGISSIATAYNGASELSINYLRRYYASFYASAGAEFIVQKHLVIFTEPLFYMSLQKVGLSNYHQYNLGLSGGIRYQF